MADAQSNIKVSIDTTEALASIKNLQRQISAFHTSMAKSGAAANAVTAQMQQNLINSVNATGKFSAQMKTIKTTTESFTDSLQKNKFSMGEYFRYAGGASKSFGRLFKTEFETINKVARENVKDLQTQYIKMGRDANGAMKAIAVRPLALDMNDLATKTMIASEKQALLNQLLKQGSTNLLNFGKNTQWAGRQLMVGFTIPLIALGSAASKTFMDMETQAIRFKKVYGDLFTPASETQAALEGITELGKQFTKYGIAVSTTVGLASEAAAAGFKGLDLQRQTSAATKLSILGQVDSQKALETTIALQNAFSMSSENLAESIDFLNAVENQTVLSLDDVSTAIPKAAPIVQQLGGDVKDLAFFMTAMKEGGINASEGANALKSGLASLINPTGKAAAMLEGFGINAKKIVVDNKGDLKKTVIEFATALNQLDPLNRAQAIEQMFGKFQFSRLSTLFANVTKEGTQASRVLDLAGASVQDLAALSEKELGMTSESAMNKFKASVENLKLSLVPVGEEFLKAVTPIAEFVTKILDRFNNLGDGTKKIIVTMTAIIAGLGPVLLMTFGLLANGLANIIKGFTAMKTLFNKTGQSSATLGTEVKYMTLEQRNAAAVAASLDQVHRNLAQTFTSEATAVNALTTAYQRSIAAQGQFMPVARPMGRGPLKKFADGKPSIIGGTGNQDSELALLQPGETVIPTKMSKKYGALINGMIADNIPGYKKGRGISFGGKTYDIPVSSNEQALNESLGRFSKDLDGVTRVLTTLEQEAKLAGDSFKHLSSDALKETLDAQGVPRNNPRGTSATLYDNEKYVFAHAKPQNAEITDPKQIQALAGQTSSKSLSRDLRAAAASGGKVQQLSSFGFMMPESANKRTSGGNFEMGRDQMASLFTGPKAERTLAPIYQSWAESNGLSLKAVLADPKLTKEMHSSVARFGGLVGDEIKQLPKNFGEKDFYNAVDRAVQRIDKADAKLTRAVADMQQTSMLAVDNSKSGKVLERRTVGKKDKNLRRALGTPANFTNYKDVGNRNLLVMGDRVAQASGAKDAAAYNRGAASASTPNNDKYMQNRSKQRSAHNLAPKDGRDDAVAYQTAVEKSIARNQRKLAKRGQSAPTIIPSRMSRVKGAASKVGGKLAGRGAAVGMAGNSAMIAASFLPGKMGELAQKIMPAVFGFQALSMILKMLPGPFKLVTLGVAATVGIIKLLNAAKERERLAVEGLGDAATVSEKKLKTLGDFFGIVPTKVDFLSRNNATDNTGANAQQQSQIDSLQQNENFQKEFKKDIESLRKGTAEQAALVFDSIAIQLRGSGFAKEQIDLIIKALQEESGKTDVKFSFGNIDLSTDEGILNFDKNFNTILKNVDKAITQTVVYGRYQNQTNEIINQFGEGARQNIKLAADAATGFINGLTGQLKNGTISAEQFSQGFARISSAIAAMPKPEQLLVLGAIIKTLPEELQKGVNGLSNFNDKMLVLRAQAVGLTTDLTKVMVAMNLLDKKPTGPNAASRIKNAKTIVAQFNKELAALEKMFGIKTTSGGTTPNGYVDPDTASGGKKLTDEERYLKILDKQIDALKAKQDAQKKINDEIQREVDLINELDDLASKATTAKLTGNYIEAAMFGRQAIQAQQEFDRQTQLNLQEEPIDKLMARKKEIEDGAKLTNSEKSQLPKKVVKKANGGLIKGPGTGRSDSIRATLGYAGGGSIRVSNGEFVVKASSVGNYGIDKMNAVNNGTADIITNSGGTSNTNVTMYVTGSNSDEIAKKVMVELDRLQKKNNKTNMVAK